MNTKLYSLLSLLLGLLLGACQGDPLIQIQGNIDADPDLFPNYRNVTIPVNIAPLNFSYLGNEPSCLKVEAAGDSLIQLKAEKGLFSFPVAEWKRWMKQYAGDSLQLTVLVKRSEKWLQYRSFCLYIVPDTIDSYLSYRLIPPGYEGWREMGLYQRNLTTYEQQPLLENRLTKGNCLNCHAYCNRNPERMLFHARAEFDGTVLLRDGVLEKLATKTDKLSGPLVYPYWHPSGDYIAFSMNRTRQNFYTHDSDRIEVYDTASDVVVYRVKDHQIVSSPLLRAADAFETFPTFSPDGRSLYYCSAKAVDSLPQQCRQVKYSLCRIDFDPEKGTFGKQVDTLYHAQREGKSVSFPRISPDGRYLVFTLHDYGTFSIWHKEADLQLIDLQTGRRDPLHQVNSDDVESYHSWSGNSRWLVFSSRRIDGLYTRPYMAYVDTNGVAHTPFLLPQADPFTYYNKLMFSYNIPELMYAPVKIAPSKWADCLRNGSVQSIREIL